MTRCWSTASIAAALGLALAPFPALPDHVASPPGESELRSIIAGTSLERDVLSRYDTPEVLRRVLKQGPYASLTTDQYADLLDRTAREFPESRVAHEALANLLIGHTKAQKGADFLRGVNELKRAAELSIRDGVVRYEPQLPHYLALVGDEEGLHSYAQSAFQLLPEGPSRYSVYLYYASALAEIGNALAEDMFARAIETRPPGQWGAYELYARHLAATKRYGRLLELITPRLLEDAEIMGPVFRRLRCEALRAVGRTAELERECRDLKLTSQREASTSVGGSRGRAAKVNYPHDSNQPDDCRYQGGCLYHAACPTPGYCICYNAFVWNLAEIALNEANGEPAGAQTATAWTSRNRAIVMSTPGCGGIPGANTGCTSSCPWPSNSLACELQKKYCCVIHAPDQFNRTHIPSANVLFDVLERMRRVVDGQLPDPVSGYVPANATGCQMNECDGTAYCNTAGSPYTAAPDGPLYWYGNYATNYQCLVTQAGVNPAGGAACAIMAKEQCGNSPDGSGPTSDNCFSRATRIRTWQYSDFICGGGCESYSLEKRLYPGGYAYRIPPETPPFKTPGGKWFNVTLALNSGAASQVRAILYRSNGTLLYDFGPATVSTATATVFTYKSTLIVNGAGYQLYIRNDGPGTVKLMRAVSFD